MGSQEHPGSTLLGPRASVRGKGKFCLSGSSVPLSRETIWTEDKVNKLVLQMQQTCLGWTQPCLPRQRTSLYLGPTLPVEQRSHFPLSGGHAGRGSDITFWRESGDLDSSPRSAVN